MQPIRRVPSSYMTLFEVAQEISRRLASRRVRRQADLGF
jgi:hypothetical protein